MAGIVGVHVLIVVSVLCFWGLLDCVVALCLLGRPSLQLCFLLLFQDNRYQLLFVLFMLDIVFLSDYVVVFQPCFVGVNLFVNLLLQKFLFLVDNLKFRERLLVEESDGHRCYEDQSH